MDHLYNRIAWAYFEPKEGENEMKLTDKSDQDQINSIDTIVNDMKLSHEAAPHGVPPDYSWAKKPRVHMGNDPGDWNAMITWGQEWQAFNLHTLSESEIRKNPPPIK